MSNTIMSGLEFNPHCFKGLAAQKGNCSIRLSPRTPQSVITTAPVAAASALDMAHLHRQSGS